MGLIVEILDEGIDIRTNPHGGGVVSWTGTHELNVDTSVKNNPTVDRETIPGVEIWSIFKRRRGCHRHDGNPLVHALKCELKWRFKSENDRKAVERQFNKIAEKFVREHHHDITLIVPSTNRLNNYILDVILEKEPDIQYIEGLVKKLRTEEVYAMASEGDSAFMKKYADDPDNALDELAEYLDEMDQKHDGLFVRNLIINDEMRNVLDKTLKRSDMVPARVANKLNGSDVLILDDTISRGQTIKEMVKLIPDSYSPKSITVLTLFSNA